MKAISQAQNKVGTQYALVELKNGNGLVYIEKHNYVRGGMVTRWFCCNLTQKQSHGDFQKMAREGLPMAEAEKFFNKKLNSKTKS